MRGIFMDIPEEFFDLFAAMLVSALTVICFYLLSSWFWRKLPERGDDESLASYDRYECGEQNSANATGRYLPRLYQWIPYFSVLHTIGFIITTAGLAIVVSTELAIIYSIFALFIVFILTDIRAEEV
jgi:hypothetical protein